MAANGVSNSGGALASIDGASGFGAGQGLSNSANRGIINENSEPLANTAPEVKADGPKAAAQNEVASPYNEEPDDEEDPHSPCFIVVPQWLVSGIAVATTWIPGVMGHVASTTAIGAGAVGIWTVKQDVKRLDKKLDNHIKRSDKKWDNIHKDVNNVRKDVNNVRKELNNIHNLLLEINAKL
jgi:hypothetical protein